MRYLALAILLASCTPTYHYKVPSGAIPSVDKQECRYEARRAVAPLENEKDYRANILYRELIDECLQSRGYYKIKEN